MMKKTSLVLMLSMVLLYCNRTNAQSIASAIIPQYVKGNSGSGSNTDRVPFFAWIKITGFQANTTYRYNTRAIREAQDGATSKGAGNQIFVHQSGNLYTSQSSLNNIGQYDSLVTDANGEYEGWFGMELTGNARFTDGNFIKMRLVLNDGAGGSTAQTYLTSADSSLCLEYSTTSGTGCSAVFSHSKAADKNFAFLFDNVSGSGRPIAIAVIEQDGLDYRTLSFSSQFYKDNVDSISGAWGTVIPNSLSNGIRRIENHKISDGSLVHADTDADGVWTTGSVNTVSTSNGNTAIEISGVDAPLIPSSKSSVSFSATTASIGEGAGNTTVTINISAAPTANETVDISITGGTATNNTDFSLASSSATFTAGSSSSQTITINITDDMLTEGAEDIVLALRNPSAGLGIGADSVITITINDNDVPNVSFASSSSNISEAGDTAWVTVAISNPDPANSTSVDVALTGGTATSGSDFDSYSTQTLTFPAGSSASQKVWVKITDDNTDDNDETLVFTLQNATNSAQITGGTYTLTIIDNDTTISASKADVSFKVSADSVVEGSTANVEVSISAADTSADISFQVAASGGTAVSGTHYTYATQTVTFLKGTTTLKQTIQVTTKSDNLKSGSHTLNLALQNLSSNAKTGSNASYTLTIQDDGKTGIVHDLSQVGAELYPNPTHGNIYVTSKENIEAVTITDMNGQIVYTDMKLNNKAVTLTTEGFSKGMYILHMQVNNSIAVQKIMVY